MLIDIHQKCRKEEDEMNSINDTNNDPTGGDQANDDNVDFNNVPEGDIKGDIESPKKDYTTPSPIVMHAHPHYEQAYRRATKSDCKRVSLSSDKYGTHKYTSQFKPSCTRIN